MEAAKLISILAYLGILLVIGWVASRRMRDVREYYAAGKGLSFLPAAFSARASNCLRSAATRPGDVSAALAAELPDVRRDASISVGVGVKEFEELF